MKHISIKFLVMLMAVIMVFSVLSISIFADDTEAVNEETTTVATQVETTEPTTNTNTNTNTNTETQTPVAKWFSDHLTFVIAVGIIVVLVLAYFVARLVSKKFKEKSTNFWKEYNSQFKKLVWPSKEQVWKNAAVVFAAIIIFGAVLALLDYGISQGIYGIKQLVEYILPAGK